MIRNILLTSLFVVCATVSGQSFRVVTEHPAQAGGEAAITSSLVAPLDSEGAGEASGLRKQPGIIAAAKKLASGFRDETRVDFVSNNDGEGVLYEIPDLSGGKSSQGAVFHSANLYLERQGDTMTIRRAPVGYDLFDNAVVRFVMLGTPLPANSKSSPYQGSVRFKSSLTIVRVVEWKQDSVGKLTIHSAIESNRRLVPSLKAVVSLDRRSGHIVRMGKPGVPSVHSTFVRLQGSPQRLDLESAFPKGLTVQDYRRDSANPTKYIWGEDSPPNLRTREPEPPSNRLTILGSGFALAGIGLFLLRKRKVPTA